MVKEINEPELTEEESKSIEDFENKERGIIVKSKTGRIDENRCYGK